MDHRARDLLNFSPTPPSLPPSILTKTPLIPRRFPYPDECPEFDEDDSGDSSRSLLRSEPMSSSTPQMPKREYLRKSVYDPLPNCHSNEASMTASFINSFNNRLTNKLTQSALCSSNLMLTSQQTVHQQVHQGLHQGVHQGIHQGIHQGPQHHIHMDNNQKMSKILEESAKSKSFLIKTLFLSILFLLLITTVLVGATGLLWVKLQNQESCLTAGDEGPKVKVIPQKSESPYEQLIWQDVGQQEALSSHLMSLFDPQKIRQNLKWIAKDMHIAGTEEQLLLMTRIEKVLKDLKFHVQSFEYDTLLNYPDFDHPNTIRHWNGYDWEMVSAGKSSTENFGLPQLEQDYRAHVWWNAYANNGTVIGNIVYANYGTEEDYLLLEKQNISLRGKIALVRYGGVQRKDKAKGAEKRGASGVIIYSDPADFAMNGNVTFPDQIWLPPSGAQRGTLLRTFGDPQTPLYPSKDYTHREYSEEQLRKNGILPTIPVMPIGYADAEKIMKSLDGPSAVWSSWRGTMPVEYKLTGKNVFMLDVKSFSQKRKIKNVVATFAGLEEPDRYVALSNHVDAWVNGAIDPGTGTSTLLEIARVVKEAHDFTGWRPRRSLAFCFWDAEEFGLIGSTEYVEEMLKSIQKDAVAVINVDNINGNGTLNVRAVPLLYRSIVKAASKIAHPNPLETENGRPTLLDAWRFYSPKGPLPGDKSVPAIGLPSSGSDHHRFISYAGVPVADIKLETAPIYSYMLYHTRYEVPWTVENLLDPTGNVLTAAGKLWLELSRSLADSLVIPFGIDDYALFLSEQLKRLETHLVYLGVDSVLGDDFYKPAMRHLAESISGFHQAARLLQQITTAVNSGDRPLSVKQLDMLNSRLQALEQCFILDYGIFESREFHRHAVFAPSENDLGDSGAFSLIMDPVSRFLESDTDEAKQHWLELVKMSFTKLQYTIESATHLLQLNGF